jgi:alpha-ribazole phosphatase
MRIHLVRHARPQGVEGICYGRQDVAVSAVETAAAARVLRRLIAPRALAGAALYSSPLSRCSDLAEAVAAGRPVICTPALLELDFGTWQGRRWELIPKQELDAWAADLWRYAPGRGESIEAAASRWNRWVDFLVGQRANTVVAFTHAGLIRVAHAVESSHRSSLLSLTVEYGSVHTFYRRTTSAFALRLQPAGL